LSVISLVKSFVGLAFAFACACAHAAVACGVTSSAVDFGNIELFSGSTASADGQIRVSCEVIGTPPISNKVDLTIKISQGNGANYSSRQLFSESWGGGNANQRIDYNLYSQASSGPIWGDGTTGSTVAVGLTITGLSSNGIVRESARTVYGRLPPINTGKKSGRYSDSLVVTISY
jgi:spore coat protein U-like protein